MLDAVVLAGGVDRGEMAAETGVAHRPLLEIGGRPIVQRGLAALRGCADVGRVALVAPEAVQSAVGEASVDLRVEAGDSLAENLLRGVQATAPGSEAVLVLTGDLPFVTPQAIGDLVRQSQAARAEITYVIIPKEACERRFPGGRRTYVKLREGTFTGGNAVVIARNFVETQQHLITHLYHARKSPIRLAMMFGLGFLLRLAAGRLGLAQLELRAAAITGARVAAVISTYPELGFDVDKLDDLYLARRVAESFDSG